MSERPILFSGPMVRAILEGRKFQTRRVVKAGQVFGYGPMDRWTWSSAIATEHAARFCPYGKPGDRLWVKETWRSWDEGCRDDHDDDCEPCEPHCNQTYVAYAATPRRGFRPKPDGSAITYLDESSPLEQDSKLLGPWKPSIHMPRWASRITLEVTGVRIERLNDISEADAMAEGISVRNHHRWGFAETGSDHNAPTYAFRSLWESINGEGSWSANPWVWVISFARVES